MPEAPKPAVTAPWLAGLLRPRALGAVLAIVLTALHVFADTPYSPGFAMPGSMPAR